MQRNLNVTLHSALREEFMLNMWTAITLSVSGVCSLLYFQGDVWIKMWAEHREKMLKLQIQLKQEEVRAIDRKAQVSEALKLVDRGGYQ